MELLVSDFMDFDTVTVYYLQYAHDTYSRHIYTNHT